MSGHWLGILTLAKAGHVMLFCMQVRQLYNIGCKTGMAMQATYIS